MAQTTLTASSGRGTGSPNARRLRAEGRIPGVLYGRGMTPVALSVERRDLRLAINGPAGFNALLSLDVDGTPYPAIIKAIQRHPIRRTVSHIDFLQVSMTEEITITLAVRLDGEAKAVAMVNGLVDAAVDSVEVVCTPTNMPSELVIDITNMQPGDVIRLGDITFPNGVTPTGDADMAVVTAMSTNSGDSAEGDADAAGDAAEGDADGE